ncbi:MAG: aspartate--tRNA(Asn) ligase [Clostridia bacterium]|nr:aspartate--tRNA(Asn) ligase [Clostridia bacterium]
MKISEIKPGKVEFQGWIENLRDKKSMQFIVIRDLSGKVQVTVVKEENPAIAEIFSGTTLESTVKITGTAIANEYVKLGGIEVVPETVEITSRAQALPIAEDSSIDQRIDYRWIDLRTERNQLMFKVQTCFVNALREFLIKKDFIEIHTPKLIGTASESGSDVFEVKYFDTKAYLAQSPQFYKQMAMAAGFERIFECGPVFRAEKSHTKKHSTEFTGFDLEFSFINSYEDVMAMEEELLTYMLEKVKEQYGDDIKRVFGEEVVVPKMPFPKMKLADVYKQIEERYGYKIDESEKNDLTTEAEKLCENLAKDMFDSEFLFVTDFPKDKRAFYHMRKDGIPQGYDLIWKGIEITTGAQREHRYEILKQQAEEKGLDKDVKFYLEFFKYGCPPHGGFGLGVDRMTMLLLNVTSLKEAEFLFRGPDRLTP